jgi:prevent-host-death family protein
MKLGLREANQHFSKAIKAVREGTEVVLTERGRPIAVIKPIREDRSSEEAALTAMADEGLITLPTRKGPLPAPRWKPATIKGEPISQTIIEDRDNRP